MNRPDKLCLVVSCFSARPIRAITALGLLMLLTDAALVLYILGCKCLGHTVAGWSSLAMLLLFLGSFQLFSIGEFNGKSFMEVKPCPRHLVQERPLAPGHSEQKHA